ncbi:MAG: hypothetical protein ABFD51_09825 [Anaerolineaceae bacterium]
MNIFGLGKVSDFLGDNIVYRNLNPADNRLPSFDIIAEEIRLPNKIIPRKSEVNYAKVIIALLEHAHALAHSNSKIKKLIFIGDTQLLDITAFTHICVEGGWEGIAFIGSENLKPPSVEIKDISNRQKVYFSNRWVALDGKKSQGIFEESFPKFCEKQHIVPNEETALVIDLDKTALGARGRNGHVIDRARVQAVRNTIAHLLGDNFDLHAFQHGYDLLNQPEYHHFTADNQDYLCYICLIIQSGFYTLDEVIEKVKSGSINSFNEFIDIVEKNKQKLPHGLISVHQDIYQLNRAGDPTPFKAFRYNEYKTTIGKMGCNKEDQPIEKMIDEEIMITREVSDLAKEWKQKGALVFGLSDKPDEATFPPEDMAAIGYQPLHRTETHILGE